MDLFDHAKQAGRAPFAAPMQPPRILPAVPLPDDFRALVRVLDRCLGKDRALPSRRLAELAGITGADPSRRIRKLIEIHRTDFPWPIHGDTARGYYRIATAEEMNHLTADIESRLRCLFTLRRTVRRQALAQGWRQHPDGTWSAPPPTRTRL